FARMGCMFTQVKGRDRSTLRQRGPCLACHAPDIQNGTGRGRGLASSHVQFGDPWLDLKVVAPLAGRTKPFVFIDPRKSSYDKQTGARLFMGWFDIDSVFGLDLTALYAVRYEHGRLSGSPLPRASTRRRVGPRSTHAPRFAIRSHDSVW